MTGEQRCNWLVIGCKDVDGENSILLRDAISFRLPVQADEHGRWIVGHAADCGDGHPMPSAGSVSRDDSHGGAELSHRRPKII